MKKIGKAQGPWTYTHFHYFNSSSEQLDFYKYITLCYI